MRTLPSKGVAAVVLVLLSAPAARGGQVDVVFEDEIIRKGAPPLMEVLIIEDSWKAVIGRKVQGEVRVPSFKILETYYGESPRSYSRAVRSLAKGRYDSAIEGFSSMLERLRRFRKVAGRPWPEQYCLYYLGAAYLRKGDFETARKHFKDLLSRVPDTRFLHQAYLNIGESFRREGDHEAAKRAFDEAKEALDKTSRSTGDLDMMDYIRRFGRIAELKAAQELAALERFREARNAFERLRDRAGKYPDVKSLGDVGIVSALVSLKSYVEAISKAEMITREAEKEARTEAIGGAYLALADAYFGRNEEGRGLREDLVKARWHYLKVATMYFDDREVAARARYRAGVCYEKLAEQEGERALELAKRQYRILGERFSASKWAREAKKRLNALGAG